MAAPWEGEGYERLRIVLNLRTPSSHATGAGPSHLRFARLCLPTGFAGRCETPREKETKPRHIPAFPRLRISKRFGATLEASREAPMLEAVFSFRGRLGRLQYFVGGLALGMAIIVPLVMIGVSMFAHGGVGAKPPLGLLALFALVAVPLFLWISLSLQARRLRDIGWNPLYVIPAVFAVDLIDQTIARLAPALAVSKISHQTVVGLLINLAFGCALLFWPGRTEDDAPSDYEPNWQQPSEPPPPAPAAPIRAPMPASRPVSATPTFGRRGL